MSHINSISGRKGLILDILDLEKTKRNKFYGVLDINITTKTLIRKQNG